MSRYSVSFQMYSARNFPPVAPQLDYLASIGYDAVELWGPNFTEDAAGFRRQLDATGLACSGMHIPLKGFVDEPQRFVDYAGIIGTDTLIPPYVPQTARQPTASFWRGVGENLAKGAEAVAPHGLKVAWHNHDFEYVRLEDRTRPIDHILEAAGANVDFEIDIGWLTRAWADPALELNRYADRITFIQLKDTAKAGVESEDGWTATGDGIIDWRALYPLFEKTRANVLVVEHDNPADWKVLAARSLHYIRTLIS